jgi:hypothetical protein
MSLQSLRRILALAWIWRWHRFCNFYIVVNELRLRMNRLIVLISTIALSLLTTPAFAEDLSDCRSDEFPRAHLSVHEQGAAEDGRSMGTFSLLINLESPEKEPNVRLADRFVNEPNAEGEVVLSDSYIHGLKIRMMNGFWRAELHLFEREQPIFFHCQ